MTLWWRPRVARGSRTFRHGLGLAASFNGVDVPWALICRMAGRLEVGVGEGELHARHGARSSGGGCRDVVGVGVARRAQDLAVDRGATGDRHVPLLEHEYAGALTEDETVSSRMEGQDRPFVDIAVMFENPAIDVGVPAALGAAVTTTSARPRAMVRAT